VSREEQVEAMIARACEEFGRLDCVFNNAGLGGAVGSLLETEVEDWDFTFAVLVRGVFLGIKHGARALQAQGEGGSIINTASVAGLSGGAGPPAYSAAKAAVVNLSRAAAVELAEHRIRVNAICPGSVRGARIDGVIERDAAERGRTAAEIRRLYERQTSLRSFVGAEDIANTAFFLASGEGAMISGQALGVDGHTESLSNWLD